MKRNLYNSLLKWKNDADRKPLILEGARQVGKTWLLKEFGRNEYENLVYVNCSDDDFAKSLFLHDLKPNRIIRDVEANTGQHVNAGRTLLFFDEIQDAPNGITSLKYFCETACCGSRLPAGCGTSPGRVISCRESQCPTVISYDF